MRHEKKFPLLHLFFSWLEFKNRTKGIIINSRVYYLITHIYTWMWTTLNCVREKESDEEEENWDEKFSFLRLDSFFFMFQFCCGDFVSIWYAEILFLRWSMLFWNCLAYQCQKFINTWHCAAVNSNIGIRCGIRLFG